MCYGATVGDGGGQGGVISRGSRDSVKQTNDNRYVFYFTPSSIWDNIIYTLGHFMKVFREEYQIKLPWCFFFVTQLTQKKEKGENKTQNLSQGRVQLTSHAA